MLNVCRLTIDPVQEISTELISLGEAAHAEGYDHLRRLIEEFASGANRFQKPDEALFSAQQNEQLVGVGGLNIDPYETSIPVARVRRLYVLPSARRLGVATRLMAHIETHANVTFSRIQLFTSSPDASEFYEQLGYAPVSRPKVSHEKQLTPRQKNGLGASA